MYKLVRTERADNQLRNIIYYIADDFGNVKIALDYLDKLEENLMMLSDLSELGHVPKYSILRKQGYWVLTVEKHLVFYKVIKQDLVVTVYAVFDSRQEYRNLL